MNLILLVIMAYYGLILTWALLPLIVALVIYKLLKPGEITLTGKLSGIAGPLNIKSTGAIAAYIVIFCLLGLAVSPALTRIDGLKKPYWTIAGNVTFITADGDTIDTEEAPQDIRIEAIPTMAELKGGVLHAYVPAEDSGDGLPRTLLLHAKGFGGRKIMFGETVKELPLKIDYRSITIKWDGELQVKQIKPQGQVISKP